MPSNDYLTSAVGNPESGLGKKILSAAEAAYYIRCSIYRYLNFYQPLAYNFDLLPSEQRDRFIRAAIRVLEKDIAGEQVTAGDVTGILAADCTSEAFPQQEEPHDEIILATIRMMLTLPIM